MGREDPQLKLRLTEEMKAKVTEAAQANGRSVNSEIVARLEQTFQEKQPRPAHDVLADLSAQIAEVQESLNLERDWMWGVVEKFATGSATPKDMKLMQPLFPERRKKMRALGKQWREANEAGDTEMADRLRAQLEQEFGIHFDRDKE